MEALIPTKCNGRVVKSKGGGSIRPFFCEIFLIIKNGPVNTGPLHYKTLSALLRFQRELPDIAEPKNTWRLSHGSLKRQRSISK